MKKWLLKLLIVLVALLVAPITLTIVTENLPDQYSKTYLSEMQDKYALLTETKQKKIIFVGGSAMAFGLRSDLIESEFPDYKVVNYGLYGTIGTKFMMDTSRANIDKDDIVILSPEINAQTYSLYFNPKTILQATNGVSPMFNTLPLKDKIDLIYNYPYYMSKKLQLAMSNSAPDPVGIYRHDSFNEYGDISAPRTENIMNNGYDSTTPILYTNDIINPDFVNYVNHYNNFVRSKKAKLYFGFSPCNYLAVSSSKKVRTTFQEKLNQDLYCDLLFNVEDSIMDAAYFYDTNFHLNDYGTIYYSNLMVNAIKIKLGKEAHIDPIPVPTPSSSSSSSIIGPDPRDIALPLKDYRGEPNNDYIKCFDYQLVGDSYQIVGVKDKYKDLEEAILPSSYNGKEITVLSSKALYGCTKLQRLGIGNSYKVLEAEAFSGCISLEKVFLYQMDGNKITPHSTDLLVGACRNIRIYVPEGANYSVGYVWINYQNYISYFKVGEQ